MPVLVAAANGHETLVRQLLGKGAIDRRSQDIYGQTPLLLAAGNGYDAIVKLLMGEGILELSLKYRFGRTALFWVAKKGHSNIVQLIREKFQEQGTVIHDEDINLMIKPAFDQESDISCNICLAHIRTSTSTTTTHKQENAQNAPWKVLQLL